MKKQVIGVVFGGVSKEHDISLLSASFVIDNIDTDKFEVKKIGISKKGQWFLYNGNTDNIRNNSWLNKDFIKSITISLDPEKTGFFVLENNKISEFENIDIIFPVLHGKNGEDGSVQALFKIANIPCVGCDFVSSAICMDKDLTHRVLNSANIKTTPHLTLNSYEFKNLNFDELEDNYKKILGYPMFIKPANTGSSIGVNKAQNKEELLKYIKIAFEVDKKIIIEPFVSGREIECAVIGNEEPFASILGEISPSNDFYDFDAKYNNINSLLFIPAELPEQVSNQIRETAIKAYKALGCSGLTRVDFFLTDKNEIILNEPNTIPGFTEISMYTKLLVKSGFEQKEIITRLIELAIEKFQDDLKYNKI
ncbi:MAG: D-alanine--D-alanine ligase [Oscillospiraceae bacterium]|nr:D-alanine--D-alanine ligase [Oscillospiraceae bacterium]